MWAGRSLTPKCPLSFVPARKDLHGESHVTQGSKEKLLGECSWAHSMMGKRKTE